MSKNLTRKGLAFGAILALGSSLFAGTAAHAADELTLAPSAGTSYNTIEGENFTLLAGLAPSTNASNTVQLKYQVVTTATLGTMTSAFVNGTAAATTAVTAGQATNTTVYKLTTGTATVGAVQKLVLASPASIAAGTPATAAVTAFFDANSNDILDAGEYTSAARTVKWSDAADVVATVTLTQPSEGDLAVKSSVSLADVNQDQISNTHLAFYITKGDGSTVLPGTTNAARTAANPAVYSGTNLVNPSALASGAYASSLTTTALGTTGGVKVAVYYLASATDNTSFLPGNASTTESAPTNLIGTLLGSATKALTARTIASVTASSVAGANIAASAGASGSRTADSRLNSEFSVSAKVVDGSSVAVASVPVTAKIEVGSAITLSSSVTVTVNGTTYTTNASLPTAIALTSDSTGAVKVTVTTAGYTVAANKNVKVTFSAQGFSDVITVTPVALTYSLIEDGAITSSTYRSVVKGSTISLGYTLQDQFKQAPAAGNYRLKSTAGSVSTSGVTAGDTYVAFAAGKAAVSYAPSGAGTFTVTAAVELQDATTANWGNPTQGALALSAVTVNSIAAQTDAVTATAAYAYAATARTSADVASAVETATDTRVSTTAVATYTAGEVVKLTGTVSQDITGIARSGAAVTVSAAGLLFSNGTLTQTTNANDTYSAGTVFKADSITVYADNSGAYTVSILSNISGTYTVTVAAGNATKTASVKFASTLAAASVTLGDLPAQAQAGRAVDLSVALKDKYGNAATTANNVTFTVTGAGYVQTTTAVAASASTGVATNRLIVLGQDLGTANIAASIVDPADSTKTISASKSVEFGVTDADVTVGGRAVYASVEFAKGKTVTVTVDGKRLYSKLFSTDAYTELKFTQKTAGKHTVTIRVSGGVVYSETVVTTK